MNSFKDFTLRFARGILETLSRDLIKDAVREARTDGLAAQTLAALDGAYVPWTMPALRPGALVSLLNDIVINRREVIVECGGGVSTIYIARLLQQRGRGHLYTIEHDAGWIETLQAQIPHEREYVTFIHAPMQPLTHIRSGEWYDEQAVLNALSGVRIDLLIVDGPNETKADLEIRYPALPILQPLFAERYGLALDDVNRSGERAILAAWQKQVPLNFHIVSNAAIGLQPDAYKSFIA